MKRILVVVVLLAVLFGCTSRESALRSEQRIVFFGDSITEQGVKPGGYVTIIRDSLAAMGYRHEVIGAGISGNKITDLLSRAEKDVLTKKPSIVFIYIGINDVWHFEFASRGLSGTTKEKFEEGLKKLIDRIQSAGAKVILCTPSVIGEKNDGSNKYDAMLDAYSAVSRQVAQETGSALCDLRKAFTEYLRINNPANAEKDILTTDGVHLNDAGNRFVAEKMMIALDGQGLFFPQK
jgi:lysophospholipase L1-like esterase